MLIGTLAMSFLWFRIFSPTQGKKISFKLIIIALLSMDFVFTTPNLLLTVSFLCLCKTCQNFLELCSLIAAIIAARGKFAQLTRFNVDCLQGHSPSVWEPNGNKNLFVHISRKILAEGDHHRRWRSSLLSSCFSSSANISSKSMRITQCFVVIFGWSKKAIKNYFIEFYSSQTKRNEFFSC